MYVRRAVPRRRLRRSGSSSTGTRGSPTSGSSCQALVQLGRPGGARGEEEDRRARACRGDARHPRRREPLPRDRTPRRGARAGEGRPGDGRSGRRRGHRPGRAGTRGPRCGRAGGQARARQRPDAEAGASRAGADPGAEGRLLRCPGPYRRDRRGGWKRGAGGTSGLPLPSGRPLRPDEPARRGREGVPLAEIRVYPQGLEARVGLAVTYAATGRRPEAIRVVSEMVRDLPRPDAYATGIRGAPGPSGAGRRRPSPVRRARAVPGGTRVCRAAADEPYAFVRGLLSSTAQFGVLLPPSSSPQVAKPYSGGGHLGRPNYSHSKRQREIVKKQKREEKLAKKLEKKRHPRRFRGRVRRERRERRADRSSESGRLSPGPDRDRSRPPSGAACCFRERPRGGTPERSPEQERPPGRRGGLGSRRRHETHRIARRCPPSRPFHPPAPRRKRRPRPSARRPRPAGKRSPPSSTS